MELGKNPVNIEKLKDKYPKKFRSRRKVFSSIHRGDTIFLHTGCGEPQYLVKELITYISNFPKAFFDTELFHVWSLGLHLQDLVRDKQFQTNIRYNSFFVGGPTRDAVNAGLADYTPIFLSNVPSLFYRGLVPIDVALIQVSPPDVHGYMSLGVSVDIVKAAIESAKLIIAQINSFMPRIHGDGFIHIDEVDFLLHFDEPILEYSADPETEDDSYTYICQKIGNYVGRLVGDGDTIQVGYGSLPNAIMNHLFNKKNIGVHTELISDGLVELMKAGVVDNSKKTLNRGKTVASFCMGSQKTYEYVHDNPAIMMRRIDYTNNPLTIAQHDNMTAINSALQIDLTGQASAESIGNEFYSGIGGQADFMRGAILAKNGKSILTLQSTANNGTVSRIVPFLSEGAGATLNRGDVHYIVTEYGIAYLHGKNVRTRSMELISIAHPRFRPWLIKEAKKLNLIFKDQAFIPGKRGEYPEHLESWKTTKKNLEIFFRPVKISDEPLLKDFFYDLSDQSTYRRFISVRKDFPHLRLQEFVVIDYTTEMVLLAIAKDEQELEVVVGIGQYGMDPQSHTAEVAFVILDKWQNKGIGTSLLSQLTYLAKNQGLLGFSAEVLLENRPMLYVFEKNFPDLTKKISDSVYELRMRFI